MLQLHWFLYRYILTVILWDEGLNFHQGLCLHVREISLLPYESVALPVSLESKKEKHCMSVEASGGVVTWVCRNRQWEMERFPSFQALHCLCACVCSSVFVNACAQALGSHECFHVPAQLDGGEHQPLWILVNWCALGGGVRRNFSWPVTQIQMHWFIFICECAWVC